MFVVYTCKNVGLLSLIVIVQQSSSTAVFVWLCIVLRCWLLLVQQLLVDPCTESSIQFCRIVTFSSTQITETYIRFIFPPSVFSAMTLALSIFRTSSVFQGR